MEIFLQSNSILQCWLKQGNVEYGINHKNGMLEMNKLTTSLALVSAMFLADTAQAAVVNFTGEVTSQTCQFTDLSGGDFHDVKLPSVSQGVLQTVGAVAGKTPFSFKLTGCTTNDDVDIAFGTANADATNAGTLKNTAGAGAAQNVNIQLIKKLASSEEIVNLNSQTNNGKQHVSDGTQNYTFNYFAQYYATGASKAGAVTSNATISIVYP